MRRLLLTTVMGLEDLAAAEAAELAGVDAEPLKGLGRVLCWVRGDVRRAVTRILYGARLVEHVVVVLGEVEDVVDEAGLARAVRDLAGELTPLLGPRTHFAVEAVREGVEGLTSPRVASIVGEAVRERTGAPVSLDDPDVVVRAELIRGTFRLGVQVTGFCPLHRRRYRVYVHPSMLNPIVAAAMCLLAGVRDADALLDPMCGSGTIPIEAKLINPDLEACGADVSRRHVLGAAANARAAGVEVHLAVGDVRRLGMRGPFDAIVCNPPYGIRERAVGGLVRVYESLVDYAGRALRPGGRLCLVTPRTTLVRRALGPGLGVVHQRRIVQGGMQSKIMLIERFT